MKTPNQSFQKPLISVVLPTRNSRALLERRVDSLLSQTYTHWEVINVDTNSTDGTLEYLHERLPADRLRSIQNPPGLYAAWNRGIAEAQGDFVHIATSDDAEDPTFYEECVGALEETGAGLASVQYRAVEPDGTVLFRGEDHPVNREFYGWQPGRRTLRPRPAHFFFTLLFMYPAVVCNGTLVRREVFSRVGPFPTAFGPVGDWGWWLRAALLCDSCTIDRNLAEWTISDQGVTSSYARFGRYRIELEMLRKGLIELRREPEFEEFLTPEQRSFVGNFIQHANSTLEHEGWGFLWHVLQLQPDKPLHAFTKRSRLNNLPFWITRHRHRELLRDLTFQTSAA
jgi:glycosyltransferase involved in cell wall biosynthesis